MTEQNIAFEKPAFIVAYVVATLFIGSTCSTGPFELPKVLCFRETRRKGRATNEAFKNKMAIRDMAQKGGRWASRRRELGAGHSNTVRV